LYFCITQGRIKLKWGHHGRKVFPHEYALKFSGKVDIFKNWIFSIKKRSSMRALWGQRIIMWQCINYQPT